ncbi:hypothetical protein D3C77_679700 [compost metagenome]
MRLAIRGQRGQQAALIVCQHAMRRLPARSGTDTATVFQAAEKGMAQEGLGVGQQRVPLGGRTVIEVRKDSDRHAGSLAKARHK